MEKRRKLSWQTIAPAVFAALVFILAANFSALAQNTKFKVGDRVECDPTQMGNYEKGTVLPFYKYDEAGSEKSFYRVRLDSNPGDEKGSICPVKWIRPLATADTKEKPKLQDETPKEDTLQQKTVRVVACPASDPDSKGKTALEKAFRGAIREGWEVEPKPGLDGKVTITFQAFRIGAAHGYRAYVDPSDAVGKTIYPVRATFTTCTDYNRSIEITRREREFSCYKNTAGEYSCTIIAAPNTNIKDKTESIDKPR